MFIHTTATPDPDGFIIAFNFFLGWCFFGWVAALVWAFIPYLVAKKRRHNSNNVEGRER